MSNVDGRWNCSVETPMGAQEFVLEVKSEGDRFTGAATGELGGREIEDGEVSGDTLHWTMAIAKPMPLTLTCEGRVIGDAIEGAMKAGVFGSFVFSGDRI
jgi:hypothetical protein